MLVLVLVFLFWRTRLVKLANNIQKRCLVEAPVTRKMVTSEKYVHRLASKVSSSHKGVEQQGGC